MNSARSEPSLSGLRSVVAGSALVGGVLLLVAMSASVFVFERHGTIGVYACLIAAGVCWASASLALAITVFTSGGPQAVAGMFLAMGIRMGAPLAVGVAVAIVGGLLAEAGLFGLIVIHYLVALIVETCVAVRLVSARTTRAATN